ncbi:hypothetical protein BBH99_10400 [Chryseobacterium contaminans]|uniref:Uncharacterized protein n=1 Tax=Chryseobacterium contaminans TaxID=1423959 RepID=A0A1M7GY39_9FLAO|nr:hypothetical protein [Chryseobacterium contaminans]OCA77934.1 hypothetical protein BBH99_10400 [Chryseobacterium contaminans]SHM21098.1 hypothetical protein SAMN05444407_1116 [Chryseobacterium contaminans]
MKKIIDKNFHLILIFTLAIIIGYWYLSSLNGLKNVSKRQKYTTALVISDWHHKDTNGIGVDYEYFVDNRRYSNTINLDLKKGQKYLLVFDSIVPESNVLLDIYPINNFPSVPVNGWKINELPIKVDRTEINNIILDSN